jgi:hypothetical protein
MALVRTVVSEEIISSINRVTKIAEVRKPLVVTSNRITLRTMWCNIPEGGIFQLCFSLKWKVEANKLTL